MLFILYFCCIISCWANICFFLFFFFSCFDSFGVFRRILMLLLIKEYWCWNLISWQLNVHWCFYIWWLITIPDQYLWQLLLDYLLEQNQQSCVQRSSAAYQSLELCDEADCLCVLLFLVRQIHYKRRFFSKRLSGSINNLQTTYTICYAYNT